MDGTVLNCSRHPKKSRDNKNLTVYDSKPFSDIWQLHVFVKNYFWFLGITAARSERFPPHQVCSSKSGNGRLPRVLVAFECWGKSKRRRGGASACRYEFARFVKIISYEDTPTTITKQRTEIPDKPCYYPIRDRNVSPMRLSTSRETKLTCMLQFIPIIILVFESGGCSFSMFICGLYFLWREILKRIRINLYVADRQKGAIKQIYFFHSTSFQN